MSASWNVSWNVFDRICSWSSFIISLCPSIESDLHSSARFPTVARNLFVFYKWSSNSYSPEVVRSFTLITDSLLLDVVCSSVSQGRSRQRDSVSTCLAGASSKTYSEYLVSYSASNRTVVVLFFYSIHYLFTITSCPFHCSRRARFPCLISISLTLQFVSYFLTWVFV